MENALKYNMHSYDVSFSGSKSFRKSVKFVRFDNSIIDFVPKQLYEFFENLERLEITNSTLQVLDKNSFAQGVNLREIHLENNNIQVVEGNAFEKLTKLESLNLDGNHVQYLKGELFKNNAQLQHVNLRNNMINYIDQSLVYSLKNLKSLDLSGNDCAQNLFENDDLENVESELKSCFINAKNETLRKVVNDSEKMLVEKVNDLLAQNAAPEEQKYFMDSLAIEFSLTVFLFVYVMKSLWDKLLRSSAAKKNMKKAE